MFTSESEPNPALAVYPEGTVTEPLPFGESTKLPFELVVEIVFASKVKLSIDAVVNPLSAVIVPPSDVSVSPIVIPSLASFAFAIEPANIVFVTPPDLTLRTSELVSIDESSTPTASVTEAPSATEPPPDKPSPAVTVTALLASFAFAIEPAS